MALRSIDSIKSLDNKDYGANLASAHILNQRGLYGEAAIEIKGALELSGNENIELYAELTRRKRAAKK